ncbi:MAG TPA: ThuA domain-containing protein [Planctomycetota bacterium]|jgi:hypothetical protein
MKRMLLVAALLASLLTNLLAAEGDKIAALIVDGQNNHNWKADTPLLKKALEASGRFTVDVATSPPGKGDMSTFKPDFSKYAVIVSNYNGDPWSPDTKKAFEAYMSAGGGLVIVHAADNSFPEWVEFNKMIGIGGWGGRNEKSGPYVKWKDGQIVKDTRPGGGGGHGKQHEYVIDTREPEHPIMKGLPEHWKHTIDELYANLRGPAENMTVLATTFSDKSTGGTGEHEPALMVLNYGKGRIFHTIMGHAGPSIKCVGFVTTLQRGAEWAATGKVTIAKPDNFPTAEKSSVWEAK